MLAVKHTHGVTIEEDFHSKYLCGLSTEKKIEKLIQMGIIVNDNYIWNTKQSLSEQQVKSLTKTHIYDVLRTLSLSYSLYCCSNATMKTVTQSLYSSKLTPFIKRWYSNECVSAIKPAPDMYLKAIHDSRYKDTETLIVEDSDIGIRAAELSGAHVLRVLSPNNVSTGKIQERINEIEYCNTYGRTRLQVY
jgi:beta-phosphoglucomutase-like phosphatase (HAD superfamily)